MNYFFLIVIFHDKYKIKLYYLIISFKILNLLEYNLKF